MHWQDRFIASCASWSDFWERAKKLSTTGEKGAVFERLTQLYLQTTPEYRSDLKDVWALHEVPTNVRKLLALPMLDEGIDFIARTRHGKYWAIQSIVVVPNDGPQLVLTLADARRRFRGRAFFQKQLSTTTRSADSAIEQITGIAAAEALDRRRELDQAIENTKRAVTTTLQQAVAHWQTQFERAWALTRVADLKARISLVCFSNHQTGDVSCDGKPTTRIFPDLTSELAPEI